MAMACNSPGPAADKYTMHVTHLSGDGEWWVTYKLSSSAKSA